jgi:hypothetical protein
MTLKQHDYPTNETFAELAFKLKLETRLVRFGPFNAMPKNTDRFPKPWVGEVDERGEYFKLFRTKGSDNTSDLSVHGKYIVRSGQTMIAVQHKLHFTALIGFAGLALFVVAAFYLLSTKGIIVHPILQVVAGILALAVYGYTFCRDLRADEKTIRQLIYARLEHEDEELEGELEEEEDDDEFKSVQ